MSHDEPPDPKSGQHADLALKLKAEMLVLSGEDLTAEMWRALARTDITAEELVALACSVSHPEDGPLSRAIHLTYKDDIPPLLITVCRTLLITGHMRMTWFTLVSVCGKFSPSDFARTTFLPLLAEFLLDLCASWADDPLGKRCTHQLIELQRELANVITSSEPQSLDTWQQDRLILAAASLMTAVRANDASIRLRWFRWAVLWIAERLDNGRWDEVWEATGLQEPNLLTYPHWSYVGG